MAGCGKRRASEVLLHPLAGSPNQISELQPKRPMSVSASQCMILPMADVDYLVHLSAIYTSPVSDGMLG
jgi:hypothetical protein